MKIHQVAPGSPEWHALRARCRCASEAPVVMNASRHLSRQEFVRMKALGLEKEFSDYVREKVLAKGHEIEASARAIVEERSGEALFPAVVTDDEEQHLASLDGMDMGEEFLFECKSWNAELEAMLERGVVDDPHYYWQLEHQLMVVPQAGRVMFTVSDGSEENTRFVEYVRVPGRREELLAGWGQVEKDIVEYVHVEDPAKAVGKTMEALPALVIDIEGHVVSSNLEPFRLRATALIESINTNLQTDEDFASAENAVKFCNDGEDRLKLVKDQAIAKMASIDELFRTIDEITAQLKAKRLHLGGLVTTRKETIRAEIAQKGKVDFEAHIAALNTRLGKPYMPVIKTDFAGAIRGKKTVKSLRDGVAGHLAELKLESNRIADGIQINLNWLREHAGDYIFLFADTAQLVLKDHDYVQLEAKRRIAAHKEEEERKKREAEEKRQREAQEAQDRQRREEAAAQQRAQEAQAQHPQSAGPLASAASTPAPSPAAAIAAATPSSNVRPLPRASAAPAQPTRPTDDEIIDALTLHYRVHESVVIGWLLDMDVKAASDRLAAHI